MYGIFTAIKPTALAQVKCINAFVKQRWCLFVLNLPYCRMLNRCENYCSHQKLVIMFPWLSDTVYATCCSIQGHIMTVTSCCFECDCAKFCICFALCASEIDSQLVWVVCKLRLYCMRLLQTTQTQIQKTGGRPRGILQFHNIKTNSYNS